MKALQTNTNRGYNKGFLGEHSQSNNPLKAKWIKGLRTSFFSFTLARYRITLSAIYGVSDNGEDQISQIREQEMGL